jgi:hypothetical protein
MFGPCLHHTWTLSHLILCSPWNVLTLNQVAHNLAVARYYAGKLSNGTESFFKAAQAAKRQMQGKDQDTEAAPEDFDDEAECAVISYNLAVVVSKPRPSPPVTLPKFGFRSLCSL